MRCEVCGSMNVVKLRHLLRASHLSEDSLSSNSEIQFGLHLISSVDKAAFIKSSSYERNLTL